MTGVNGPPGDDFADFVAQYDLREQEEKFRTSQRKHDRVMKRWSVFGGTLASIAAAAAVVGLAIVIWLGVRGPSADDEIQRQLKSECIAEHGTWIKVADGPDSTYGSCMFGDGSR